jgi:hypothetical protein
VQDDPLHYAHLIDKVLNSCKLLVADQEIDPPICDTSQSPRGVFWWKTSRPIKLHSGDRIAVRDQRLYRIVKPATILDLYQADYQLLNENDDVIFRFCTHGASLRGHEAAHIHNETNERIEEGDGRLHGQTLVGADFLLFFKYVCSYLNGEQLPWQ